MFAPAAPTGADALPASRKAGCANRKPQQTGQTDSTSHPDQLLWPVEQAKADATCERVAVFGDHDENSRRVETDRASLSLRAFHHEKATDRWALIQPVFGR